MALTSKQRLFVAEYVQTWNATEAYARAYGTVNRETAGANGHRLLKNAEIAEEIERVIDSRCMSKYEVLTLLTEQARATYSAYIKEDATVDVRKMIKDGKAHLIKSIKRTKYGKDIEFHDAFAARVQIGKYHKLFVDRSEISGPDGDAITVKQVDYRNGIDTA